MKLFSILLSSMSVIPSSLVLAQITDVTVAPPRTTTTAAAPSTVVETTMISTAIATSAAASTPATSAPTTNALSTSALASTSIAVAATSTTFLPFTYALLNLIASSSQAASPSLSSSSSAKQTILSTPAPSFDTGSLNNSTKQILIIIGSCVGGVILLLLLFCIIQRCRYEKYNEDTVVAPNSKSSAYASRPLDSLAAPPVDSVPYVPYYGYGYQATYMNPAYNHSPQIVYSDSNGGYYQDVEGPPIADEYYGGSNVGADHQQQYYGNRAADPPAIKLTTSSLPEHL